jgi:hypothetical protein
VPEHSHAQEGSQHHNCERKGTQNHLPPCQVSVNGHDARCYLTPVPQQRISLQARPECHLHAEGCSYELCRHGPAALTRRYTRRAPPAAAPPVITQCGRDALSPSALAERFEAARKGSALEHL